MSARSFIRYISTSTPTRRCECGSTEFIEYLPAVMTRLVRLDPQSRYPSVVEEDGDITSEVKEYNFLAMYFACASCKKRAL